MDFDLWWISFMAGGFSRYFRKPNEVDFVSWSSEKNQKFFVNLSERLVDHRDSHDNKAFNELCAFAEENFKENNAGLVVKAAHVTIAYKSGDFELAKTLLHEFERLLPSSKDKLIFEVRLRLSQCLVARRMGNYEEGYQRSIEGLQLGQTIPPGLCLLWLYLESAMNIVCLAFQNKGDHNSFRKMKNEALAYLEEAARVASALDENKIPYRTDDFRHKLCIYKALVLLNSAVTGETVDISPSKEELNAASEELATVFKKKLEGKPLTKFRKIEYYLAKCDSFSRLAEICPSGNQEKTILEEAKKQACKAISLVKDHDKFNNLLDYAKKRFHDLERKIKICSENFVTPTRTFEGLQYSTDIQR